MRAFLPSYHLTPHVLNAALNPSKTIMHYKGITSTYANVDAWSSFIGALFSALEARYGADEVGLTALRV